MAEGLVNAHSMSALGGRDVCEKKACIVFSMDSYARLGVIREADAPATMAFFAAAGKCASPSDGLRRSGGRWDADASVTAPCVELQFAKYR
jgi:hypothetical protein